ncbi:MAG: hypothetical protein EOL95_05595 [Bacteroidia bacterium]|nr:hypothetical protein [Bacteroidia bacterium]
MYQERDRQSNINPLILLILTVLAGIGLWIPSLIGIYKVPELPTDSLLYSLIPQLSQTSTEAIIAAWSIVTIVAVGLFFLNRVFLFIRTETLFPIFMMVFLCGISSMSHFLSIGYFCMLLIIVAAIRFLEMYENRNAAWNAFDIAFCLSLASLIYFPSIWYLIVFAIGFILYNKFNLQVVSATIFGLLFPYMLTAGGLYLFDKLDILTTYLNNSIYDVYFHIEGSPVEWMEAAIVMAVFLISLVAFLGQYTNDKIRPRTTMLFFYLLLLCSCTLLFLYPNSLPKQGPMIYFSISITLSHFFALNNTRFSKIVFYMMTSLLVSLFIIQNII